MSLTPTQLETLKTAILADPALAAQPNTADGAFVIAAAMNSQASPDFTVWKTSVGVDEIMQNGFVWTTVDSMTVGKARIWDWMSKLGAINPSRPNVRQGLTDAFGSGTAMANAIVPYLKRLALRIEKLFATGTGSVSVPATLVFEGTISFQDVQEARNLT